VDGADVRALDAARCRACETSIVENRIYGDAVEGILLLVGARAALCADCFGEWKEHALHLIVAQLHLEPTLGTANRALHLVLDRHARLGVEVPFVSSSPSGSAAGHVG